MTPIQNTIFVITTSGILQNPQGKIFGLWDDFNNHDITTAELLKSFSIVYAQKLKDN